MKGLDQHVQDNARRYLAAFRHFTFSIITRYEILRGLKAHHATRQIVRDRELACLNSTFLLMTAVRRSCKKTTPTLLAWHRPHGTASRSTTGRQRTDVP
jgi:hypothetical protein